MFQYLARPCHVWGIHFPPKSNAKSHILGFSASPFLYGALFHLLLKYLVCPPNTKSYFSFIGSLDFGCSISEACFQGGERTLSYYDLQLYWNLLLESVQSILRSKKPGRTVELFTSALRYLLPLFLGHTHAFSTGFLHLLRLIT